MPLTPIYLAAVSGTGVTGSIRPDYTGAPLYSDTGGRNLNPAAYTAPPQASGRRRAEYHHRAGAVQHERIHGANFPRHGSLECRPALDATNVLNHVTYSSWVTTVTDSALFGLPVSANAMRAMQVTLRMRF